MAWSRLSINVTRAKLCEGGRLRIGISRSGNLNISSFLSVAVTSKSARAGVDYAQNYTHQIQFDPG